MQKLLKENRIPKENIYLQTKNWILYNADFSILKQFDKDIIDLIITDPPYIIGYKTNRRKKAEGLFAKQIANDSVKIKKNKKEYINDFLSDTENEEKNIIFKWLFSILNNYEDFFSSVKRKIDKHILSQIKKNYEELYYLLYSLKEENKQNIPFKYRLNELFWYYNDILKNNKALYVFGGWKTVDIFKKYFEEYFKLKNILIWEKNNHTAGDLKAGYAPKYEMILYWNKWRAPFNWKRIPDIWNFDKVSSKESVHPHQKPIPLLKQMIEKHSEENDIILDSFVGSGATLIAAEQTWRKWIWIEISEETCKTVEKIFDKNDIKYNKNL